MWTSRWGLMHITVLLYIFSDCPWFIQLLNYSKGEFHKIGKKSLSAPLINRLKWLCKMFIYSRLKTRKNEAFFCKGPSKNVKSDFVIFPKNLICMYGDILHSCSLGSLLRIEYIKIYLKQQHLFGFIKYGWLPLDWRINMIFELEAKGIGLCTTCVHYYCFPMYIFKDKFLQ